MIPDNAIDLNLPWPPSVNHYWRNVNGVMKISQAGRIYQEDVGVVLAIAERPKVTGRVGIYIVAYPPDKRRRDLDNLLKATLDSLQAGGVFEDDGQIDDLRIVRSSEQEKGFLAVRVWEIVP